MDIEYILTVNNLSKTFPGVKALDDVSFQVKRGAVHALVGENGAGKSTLIKILAGIFKRDSGEVMLNDSNVRFKTPHDAQTLGVSVVHQELKLVESLSIMENIFLGKLKFTKTKLVDWKAMKTAAKEMIHNLGMDIDVETTVDSLSVAQKQIIEICKAINFDCKLLIMDEPSAVLTEKELKIMYGVIKRLKSKGITIIYISHRLDEIFEIADDVTILRDGQHISTTIVSNIDRQQLISMMVGRKMGNEYPREFAEVGDVVLEVEKISRKNVLHDISFNVRKGEVLGLAGLVGSGRTELAKAILGIDKIDSGKILLKGKKAKYRTFKKAITSGFGLVPEDRKEQGLIQIASVKENICLVSINKIIKSGIVSKKLETKYASEYVNKLNISASSLDTEAQFLSGGNQQKVVIAKWLMQESQIFFLDEPTRGIDVGAKAQICKIVNQLVKEGKSVVLISSELPEVISMSDRIMVMHKGRIVGEFSREEANQEKIIELCV